MTPATTTPHAQRRASMRCTTTTSLSTRSDKDLHPAAPLARRPPAQPAKRRGVTARDLDATDDDNGPCRLCTERCVRRRRRDSQQSTARIRRAFADGDRKRLRPASFATCWRIRRTPHKTRPYLAGIAMDNKGGCREPMKSRKATALVAAGITASAFAVGGVVPHADASTPSGGNGRLAFVTHNQIFTIDADGSDRVQLTTFNASGGKNYLPEWSPSGTRIAYVHETA